MLPEGQDSLEEVEIVEAPVEEKVELDLSVLSPQEQEMVKGSTKVEDNVIKEEKPVAKVSEDKKSFEEVEKDEKGNLGAYNKNEQALYFKWKADKKVRQDAQAERDLAIVREKSLKSELEKARSEGSLTIKKINEINRLLSGDSDNITIEAIQNILGATNEASDDKPLTKKDLENLQKEELEKKQLEKSNNDTFVSRVNSLEEFSKVKFENYDDIVVAAKEVIDGKVEISPILDVSDISKRLVDKINNKDIDEDEISEYVLGIAKLNPNFGKKSNNAADNNDGKKLSSENIDRIVKNAAKSNTSAVNAGNSRRVGISDLTLEDAAKLTPEQWRKLPENVRRKLMA